MSSQATSNCSRQTLFASCAIIDYVAIKDLARFMTPIWLLSISLLIVQKKFGVFYEANLTIPNQVHSRYVYHLLQDQFGLIVEYGLGLFLAFLSDVWKEIGRITRASFLNSNSTEII